MSAFCVFGVTLEGCIEKTKKSLSTHDRKLKRELTQDEWIIKVNEMARIDFESFKGAKQISPAFDTPQFAQDWINIAKKTVESHSTKIMCRNNKYDAKGGITLRKGVPVITWVPYTPPMKLPKTMSNKND